MKVEVNIEFVASDDGFMIATTFDGHIESSMSIVMNRDRGFDPEHAALAFAKAAERLASDTIEAVVCKGLAMPEGDGDDEGNESDAEPSIN